MAKAAQTSAQVLVDFSTGELDTRAVSDYKTFREMRLDPTISLLRKYAVAYTLASTWGVEGNDPEQVSYLEEHLLPFRQSFMRTAMYGLSDFGWKAYEIIYGKIDLTFPSGETRTLQGIDELKPLKNDNCRVRYAKEDGSYQGLSYVDMFNGNKVLIDAEHSLFINFDDEGLGEYGIGNMAVAQQPYEDWNEANEGAIRYDKKMAGSLLVIRYPVGKTPYKGVETDNAQIAEDFVKAIRSSGSITVPLDIESQLDALAKMNEAWKIEYIEHSAQQASFVDRMKYLDAQKCRAFAIPERAVLEGEFGTKAEAGIHASAALLNMQLMSEMITELLNNGGTNRQTGLVNRLLMANFNSEKNGAWLTAPPLTDERVALFIQILTTLLADPGAGPEIMDKIDLEQLVDVLDLPVKKDEPTATKAAGDDAKITPVEASGEESIFSQPRRPTSVTVSMA